MKAEYDLSRMKSRRNPYASKLKKPVTMRLSEDVVAYSRTWRLRLVCPIKASSISISATASRSIGG